MNSVKLPNTQFTQKSVAFLTLKKKVNYQKEKEKNPIMLKIAKKNKIIRNKLNQGGERPIL